MSDIREIELFIALDQHGQWTSGEDMEAATEKYTDDYTVDGPLRVAKVTIRMGLPVVVEAEGVTVPDEDTTIHVVKGGVS